MWQQGGRVSCARLTGYDCDAYPVRHWRGGAAAGGGEREGMVSKAVQGQRGTQWEHMATRWPRMNPDRCNYLLHIHIYELRVIKRTACSR